MALTTTITALTALSRASLQYDDVLAIDDIHDFTQSPQGSTKKITVTNLFTTPTFSGLITGTAGLTVAGAVTGVTTLATSGTITTSVAAGQAALGLASVGGSGRTYQLRSNTDGSFQVFDVSAGGARITIATTGAITFGSGSGVAVSGITTLAATGGITVNNVTTIGGVAVGNTLSVAAGGAAITGPLTATATAVIAGYVDGGGIRSTAAPAYAAGSGVELQFTAGVGNVLSYDRSGGAYMPLRLAASTIALKAANNTAGLSIDASGNTTFDGTVTASSGVVGNASTAAALQTARTINGVSFNGTANITVPAAAGTLTGATLAAGVTASSLTSVGTLGTLNVSGGLSAGAVTASHVIGAGASPTGTAIAGVISAVSVLGSDMAGKITFTTSTATPGLVTLVRVTYASAFGNAPYTSLQTIGVANPSWSIAAQTTTYFEIAISAGALNNGVNSLNYVSIG